MEHETETGVFFFLKGSDRVSPWKEFTLSLTRLVRQRNQTASHLQEWSGHPCTKATSRWVKLSIYQYLWDANVQNDDAALPEHLFPCWANVYRRLLTLFLLPEHQRAYGTTLCLSSNSFYNLLVGYLMGYIVVIQLTCLFSLCFSVFNLVLLASCLKIPSVYFLPDSRVSWLLGWKLCC